MKVIRVHLILVFWCAAHGPTFVGHHQDKGYLVWVSDRLRHRLGFALELMGWVGKVRRHTSGAPVFLTKHPETRYI